MKHRLQIDYKPDGIHYAYQYNNGKIIKGIGQDIIKIMSAISHAIMANQNQDYRVAKVEAPVLQLHWGGKSAP